MLLPAELLRLADTVIDSLDLDSSQYLTDESLHKLHDVFPDSLILAALDLIDQRKVTESVTPWGFVEYEVLSSTATHIVYVGLPKTLMSSYCTCPAFNFTVLETGQSLMCKHVLATRLAIRLAFLFVISVDVTALSSQNENNN
ncbi:zinc finger swim domain-containing protein 7-like [Lentinula edodes]|uniref:Zinc finger swim domain-containing protein 7-like n=1 Tax=Lentinula edodes TaxID=5353 RepID=A0A1Q3E5D7_LENED|nr:zinc finger swim domain-containing protein 7-like [Lentinula edodes]